MSILAHGEDITKIISDPDSSYFFSSTKSTGHPTFLTKQRKISSIGIFVYGVLVIGN